MPSSEKKYSLMDQDQVSLYLFHPRSDPSLATVGAYDLLIPMEGGIKIGARFHMKSVSSANILFFHGNGEIVSDYDDLASIYNGMAINFLPVDYRGYGRSAGKPNATAMMRDCHQIFDFVTEWLQKNQYTGPLIVMGRSLGSASALEIASRYKDRIDALIIESGFAYTAPLLRLLGVNLSALNFKEENGFGNLDKMQSVELPVLIIHAEFDHIIPYADGKALFDACPSPAKRLVMVPEANHNDIFLHGFSLVMNAIRELVTSITH